MIATDVASRGLDIPTVATVGHYVVSSAVDAFVHRARWTAVSFNPYPLLNYLLTMKIQRSFRTIVSDNSGVVT